MPRTVALIVPILTSSITLSNCAFHRLSDDKFHDQQGEITRPATDNIAPSNGEAAIEDRQTAFEPGYIVEDSESAPTVEFEEQDMEFADQQTINDPPTKTDDIPPPPDDDDFMIPTPMNEHVERWIDFFTKKDPERFQRFLNRGAKYRRDIEKQSQIQAVPKELYYLAMIESGFATRARSRANAIGMWQFIRGTGKRYGLKINGYVDERHDPRRATAAAFKYLSDLHRVFQSWHLAMSAYNAGELRVLQAIMKGKTRDYWELVEKKILPRETRNYVPKFIAAVKIGENPEKYGFEKPDYSPAISVKGVKVPTRVPLKAISKASGVSLSHLKLHNPHLRRITPPGREAYEIWVARDQASKVEKALPRLASKRISLSSGNYARYSTGKYKVTQGDTLGSIARKYRTSVRTLKRLNNITGSRIYAGQRLIVSDQPVLKSNQKYRVKSGDNLYAIAKKFGTTIYKIKRKNGLKRNRIYVGQLLHM